MREELERFASEVLKCTTREEILAAWKNHGILIMNELHKSNEEKARIATRHIEKYIQFDDPDTIY